MAVNLNNVDAARAAWGTDMPGWVRLLAQTCDAANQRTVADRLGKSSGYVSRLLNRKYAGSYPEAEKQVRAAFGAERVMCPVFGDMSLKTCIRNRRRPAPANWAQVQLARACPGCPNNTDRTTEED